MAGWKQEYVGPDRSRGAKIKPKRERTHFSKTEVRLSAIEAEGSLAHSNKVDRDANPCISEASRKAWFHGWDTAEAEA